MTEYGSENARESEPHQVKPITPGIDSTIIQVPAAVAGSGEPAGPPAVGRASVENRGTTYEVRNSIFAKAGRLVNRLLGRPERTQSPVKPVDNPSPPKPVA